MKAVLSALLFIASVCWAGLKTDKITATELGNRWYQHDQYGTFYDANNSDWYYHLDHGWIYVDEWDDNGTWMYMPLADDNSTIETNSSLSQDVALGWMWSTARSYPTLYNNRTQGWMYAYGKRSFYDYRCKLKFDLGLGLWEIDTSDANASSLEDLRRFFDVDISESEPMLSFHSSAQLAIFNLSLSKEKVTDDSNWTNLLNLCISESEESYNRSIFKIEEHENEFVISATVSSLIFKNTFLNTFEVTLRSADGKLNFDDTNITVQKDVNFDNVKHLGISNDALTITNFDYSEGSGSFQTVHTAIKIRAR